MWTAVFSFLKGKVFTEAGSLLIPLLIILSIFVIWNSDSILTKFGFETTANLKAEVTRLTIQIETLEEANKKLATDLKLSEETCGISVNSVTELCTVKEETKHTVDSVIDKRKKEADRIKREMYDKPDTILPIPPLLLANKHTIKEPVLEEMVPLTYNPNPPIETPKVSVSVSKVDRLSLNNIQAINEAYDELFKED